MDQGFWLDKWKGNQIGWHQGVVNRSLEAWFYVLGLSAGDTVFVPLCGKSYDLIWLLKQDVNVLGIELSQLAVEAFFSENNLSYDVSEEDGLRVYQAQDQTRNIRIYSGDFFKLKEQHLCDIKAIYDRAALVALPLSMRKKYVEHLGLISAAATPLLLIALYMDRKDGPAGPPFSLSDPHVLELFHSAKSRQKLAELNVIESEQKFQDQGCSFVFENTFLIKL